MGLDHEAISTISEREGERGPTTSTQPAWLMSMDLCACLGHLQYGCKAMADNLSKANLVFVPHMHDTYAHETYA